MAQDEPTSLTLLQRVREGDGAGWQRVVELYGPLVAFWCERRGVPRRDIPDLVQEVWAAASAGIAGFRKERPEDTFRGWLRGIAYRKAAEYWRRQDGQLGPEGGSTAYGRLQQLEDDGVEVDPAEESQHGDLYTRALAMIRDEFETSSWRAFWRTAVDGQPAPEVAAELGMTANAVRMAKSRVLRRLRAELGELIE
jgi:RNA polymerase sigma-70 factor (ECF subfamily)